MSGRRRSRTQPVTICQLCGEPVAEKWPAYLVENELKRLVGPFHPWCAHESVMAVREMKRRGLEPALDLRENVLRVREETTPW